jgi:hypothetical protein
VALSAAHERQVHLHPTPTPARSPPDPLRKKMRTRWRPQDHLRFLDCTSTTWTTPPERGLQQGPQLLALATSLEEDAGYETQAMKPYSEGLRRRIVRTGEGGVSKSAAARFFAVSFSSVKRNHRIGSPTGNVAGDEEMRGERPPKTDQITEKLF